MATNRPRAALALLCVAALCYGSVLVQPGMNADLSRSADGSGPVVTETETPEPATTTATPTATETESSSTPTDTPTPTESETPTVDDADSSDGSGGLWPLLLGFLGVGAVVGSGVLLVARAIEQDGPGESNGDADAPDVDLSGVLSIPGLPRLSQVTAAVLLTSASGLARVVDDIATVIGGVGRVFGNSVGPALGMFARGLGSVPAALASAIAAPLAALGSVGSGASSFLSDGLSKAGSIRSGTPETDARETATPPAEEDDGPEPAASVAEAWHRMVGRVSVRNPAATTPLEYARAATEHGLPEGPVRRLTDLFRRIRYGPDTESERTLEQARDALEDIRGGED